MLNLIDRLAEAIKDEASHDTLLLRQFVSQNFKNDLLREFERDLGYIELLINSLFAFFFGLFGLVMLQGLFNGFFPAFCVGGLQLIRHGIGLLVILVQ